MLRYNCTVVISIFFKLATWLAGYYIVLKFIISLIATNLVIF